MIDRYAFMYPVSQENIVNITEINSVYKLFEDPVIYKNATYNWELICDGILGIDVNISDYDIFWELIYKLKTEESFYLNSEYVNYGASNVEIDINYIEFTINDSIWHIYLSTSRLNNEYPMQQKFLIFHDENQNIDRLEIYGTLNFFLNNMGRDNNYVGFITFETMKQNLPAIFYIFYTREAPSMIVAKQLIRDYLSDKYGYEIAQELYPSLFVDSERKIYLMVDNTKYPVNYDNLKLFVEEYAISHPEVIHLLDWICPLVVEFGISDVVPNYYPLIDGNTNTNSFIFYLSKVLNYLQGKVLTPSFIAEAQFYQTEEFASFVWGGIEWKVMRINYTP